MKLLYFVFQTANRSNGGVESITQVIERLPAGSVHVVTNRETPRSQRWLEAGHSIGVWKLPYEIGDEIPIRGGVKNLLRLVGSLIATNFRAFKLARKRDHRVIHCNDIISLLHGGLGARLAGRKVIFNIRDVKLDGAYGFKWRIARSLANCILVLSHEMKEQLQERMPPPVFPKREDFRQIYSIVDFSRMSPVEVEARASIRSRLGLDSEKFHIGIVAAVCEKKNQLELFRNFPDQWCQRDDWQLHLIGDFRPDSDPYSRECAEAVAAKKLDSHVSFHGFAGAVEDWYKALDLVLVVSRREGMARCMIEGVSCGAPVLSYDVTSAREILEGYSCGKVVPFGDWSQLFQKLEMMSGDQGNMKEMSKAGTEAARKLFDATRVVESYQNLYEEIST